MKQHKTLIIVGVLLLAMALVNCNTPTTKNGTVSPSNSSTTLSTPSPTNDLLWQSDFASFAEEVKTTIRNRVNPESVFTGKTIRWTVTYKSFSKSQPKVGNKILPLPERGQLEFDEATRYAKENPSIVIHADLQKSEFGKTVKLKQGDKITIKCQIGIAIITSGTSQGEIITSGETSQDEMSQVKSVIIGPKDCILE